MTKSYSIPQLYGHLLTYKNHNAQKSYKTWKEKTNWQTLRIWTRKQRYFEFFPAVHLLHGEAIPGHLGQHHDLHGHPAPVCVLNLCYALEKLQYGSSGWLVLGERKGLISSDLEKLEKSCLGLLRSFISHMYSGCRYHHLWKWNLFHPLLVCAEQPYQQYSRNIEEGQFHNSFSYNWGISFYVYLREGLKTKQS